MYYLLGKVFVHWHPIHMHHQMHPFHVIILYRLIKRLALHLLQVVRMWELVVVVSLLIPHLYLTACLLFLSFLILILILSLSISFPHPFSPSSFQASGPRIVKWQRMLLIVSLRTKTSLPRRMAPTLVPAKRCKKVCVAGRATQRTSRLS